MRDEIVYTRSSSARGENVVSAITEMLQQDNNNNHKDGPAGA